MKSVYKSIFFQLLVLLIGLTFNHNTEASQSDPVNCAALRRAVQDVQARHGDAYPQGEAYLRRLDAFEAQGIDSEAFQQRLGAGDEAALKVMNDMRAFQREVILDNPEIDFSRILAVKRHEKNPGLPQNWQGNSSLPRTGYDNEIIGFPLDGADPQKNACTTLYKPEMDVFVGDVCLHWDGDRLLFSSLNANRQWHVFEMALDGSGLRQVTPDKHQDVDYYDATYLPDGRIVLCSTAGFVAVPCVYGSDHVSHLFLLDEKQNNLRQLGFDQDHNWCPCVLPNGRVLYQRWEYSDTPHSNTRMLFHANPDGTDQREYWGSGVYFPNSFFYARPIPGTAGQVIGVASGHHGTPRSGRLLIVAPGSGRGEGDGVIQEIPGWGKPVTPIVRDRLVDGVWPQFLHPFPVTDRQFLVSAKMGPESPWGIYLVDVFDNMVLLANAGPYSLFEPVPLRKEARPPVVPDRVNLASNEGVVFMQDVYEGGGLEGVKKGDVTALRVYQYYFSHRGQGGLHGTLGNDTGWDIKRVLGTVPVSPDGSAFFKAPANVALAVQPLDKKGQALQVMRSWFTLQPGEQASCVGCHESQRTAPPSVRAEAFLRSPTTIEAGWHAPQRGYSFIREVQPVLDRHCAGCHGDAPPEGMVIPHGREFPYLRGDKQIQDWNTQVSGGVGPDMGGRFTESYAALQRFLRRPGIESDIRMLTPMDYHFSTTELGQLLRKGHYNVKLDEESWQRLVVWFDLNAPFHGTWGETHPRQEQHAPDIAKRARELRREYAPATPAFDLEYIPSLPPYDAAFIQPAPMEKAIPPDALEGWPFEQTKAQEFQQALANTLVLPEGKEMAVDLGQGVTMKLAVVPGGRFLMGSTEGHPDESPVNAVEVAPFLMGKFEVTNEQYRCFDPAHESRDESRQGYQFGRRGFLMDEPGQPVVRVSWEEAQAFCAWLGERTGLGVSLPTEAQWEWTARAGADTSFSFGPVDSDYSRYANLADQKLKEFAQCTARGNYELAEPIANPSRHDDRIPRCDRFNDGAMISVEAGRFAPNAWGLHDMHGNVWEWTQSCYLPYPYKADDGRNEILNADLERVARGGSWRDRPHRATSSFRLPYSRNQKVFNVGFRVAVKMESLSENSVRVANLAQ